MSSFKAMVLGCGRVGATMAGDLARDDAFDVCVADINEDALTRLHAETGIKGTRLDLADADAVRAALAEYDMVLGAVPSVLGLQTLRSVIEAGKSYCDISFMPEDATQLDGLAKQKRVTAVVDCGVAPGLSNMAVGHAYAQLDKATHAEIYVGGLPKDRSWPFQYKAPFAPSDVIEEYTRPARLVEKGDVVTRPALSDPEPIEFARVGTLEAFNTDGLRTLIDTIDIPDMKEKTLRYPGHIELMRVFREVGLFNKEPIDIDGASIRPLDLMAKLLFPVWRYDPGEKEFTVMRVIVDGERGQEKLRYRYDLYDETDEATHTSSMARTTAFPNAIMARMIARKKFCEPGVFPPEVLSQREGLWEEMVEELGKRGVDITFNVEKRA